MGQMQAKLSEPINEPGNLSLANPSQATSRTMLKNSQGAHIDQYPSGEIKVLNSEQSNNLLDPQKELRQEELKEEIKSV